MNHRRTRSLSRAAVAVAVLSTAALGACADDEGDRGSPTSTTVDGGPTIETTVAPQVAVIANPGEREWVAIYDVASADDQTRTDFIEAASPQGFESPAACWDGVPVRLGVSPDTFVLGVVAPTEAELTALVERLPGRQVLTGEFVRVCPND